MRLIDISTKKYPNLSSMVDDDDFEHLNQWKWRSYRQPANRTVYVIGRPHGILISMHRYIMGKPKKLEVDHIDCNGLNNCKSNLRLCTHQQNTLNRGKARNRRKYKGVNLTTSKMRFRACIRSKNKRYHLGYFDTQEQAAAAYNHAAIKYHGAFANLNIIPKDAR